MHELNLQPVGAGLPRNLGEIARKRASQSERFVAGMGGAARQRGGAELLARETLHEWRRMFDHLERGIQLASDPFDGRDGLHEEQHVRRELQPVTGDHVDHGREHLGERQIAERDVPVDVEHFVEVARQLRYVHRALGGCHRHDDLREPVGVAPRDGRDGVCQSFAQAAVHPANDAEVDEADDVAGQHENVAGMGIGVKEAVHENLFQHRVRAAARHGDRIGVWRLRRAHG